MHVLILYALFNSYTLCSLLLLANNESLIIHPKSNFLYMLDIAGWQMTSTSLLSAWSNASAHSVIENHQGSLLYCQTTMLQKTTAAAVDFVI